MDLVPTVIWCHDPLPRIIRRPIPSYCIFSPRSAFVRTRVVSPLNLKSAG